MLQFLNYASIWLVKGEFFENLLDGVVNMNTIMVAACEQTINYCEFKKCGGSILKLQIAICDDEPILCQEAKEQILKLHMNYEIDLFYSGAELLESPQSYDMIFLDIDMPEENGMEIAKELRSKKFCGHIIFLTSHTEFMADAFKVKAFRFLVKPIRIDDLNEALLESENEIFDDSKIIIDNFGREVLVNIKDIVYIQSEKRNTILYMVNQIVETGNSLKYWIHELNDYDFCRAHKSFLVALRYVDRIEPEHIYLKNLNICVPLSRRNYHIVKRRFFEYIRKHARIM